MIFLFVSADDFGDQSVTDDVVGAEGDGTDPFDIMQGVQRVPKTRR